MSEKLNGIIATRFRNPDLGFNLDLDLKSRFYVCLKILIKFKNTHTHTHIRRRETKSPKLVPPSDTVNATATKTTTTTTTTSTTTMGGTTSSEPSTATAYNKFKCWLNKVTEPILNTFHSTTTSSTTSPGSSSSPPSNRQSVIQTNTKIKMSSSISSLKIYDHDTNNVVHEEILEQQLEQKQKRSSSLVTRQRQPFFNKPALAATVDVNAELYSNMNVVKSTPPTASSSSFNNANMTLITDHIGRDFFHNVLGKSSNNYHTTSFLTSPAAASSSQLAWVRFNFNVQFWSRNAPVFCLLHCCYYM